MAQPAAAAVASLVLLVAAAGCFGGPLRPSTPGDVALSMVATGFDRPLWAGDADGALFVVEQTGRVWRVVDGERDSSPFLDLRDRVGTCHFEQGLLGLAFAPDHPATPHLWVAYTGACNPGIGDLVVERHTVPAGADRPDPTLAVEVLHIPQPYQNHNGGHVLFGPDGMLYVGVGDGGSAGDPHGHGQDPTTLLGTLLRLDVLGAGDEPYLVPPDNPFAPGQPRAGEGAPEVWAYGLRNPWRFSFDEATDTLWVADVGQDCVEEVNRVAADAAGLDYGWALYEGDRVFVRGQPCSAQQPAGPDPAVVSPAHTYSITGPHCSVTGGHVLRGGVPGLDGTYLFGDWCSGTVWGLATDGAATELLRAGFRISSFGQAADGGVYVVDHSGGGVHRVVAAS